MEGHSYVLAFVGLVPWLLVLDVQTTMWGTALCALAMCQAFVVAIFAWFGFAIAIYSAGHAAVGWAVLVASAPLLQPQFLGFALVRRLAGRYYGRGLTILAGAAAWVATEWLFPKLLADNLGHGLYPSRVLRQAADLGGTAGLTFLLVVVNECAALAVTRLRRGVRAVAPPLAVAATIIAVLIGYGVVRLSSLSTPAAESALERPLRIGLVQANITSYDRLRREMGTYDLVRYVLDTHFSMSRQAIDEDDVDALLWSETIYPTTFGRPKSETGAELDREIEDFASRGGVPVVFGSYDRDDEGEYNTAVVLEAVPIGEPPRFDAYRKTRLFLLTEYLPWWLDSPTVRRWLPWAGTWKAGSGAKVLPLRLADGREIPVLPMICLDDVDTSLAIDGARLGARVILAMSNDSWFTEHPAGAHLHLVVSAFRTIETRLPQARVTANGITAVIDRSGDVVASAPVGQRAVVIASVSPAAPPATLVVAWGDWVGPAGLVVLLALLAIRVASPLASRAAGREQHVP